MEIRQASIVGANAGLLPFSFTAVVLRFAARRRQGSPLCWDDYLVLIAEILTIAGSALQISVAVDLGFGRHQSGVPDENVTKFLYSFYAYVILYIITLATIKSALLCLYRRIFPIRYMRILSFIVQAIVICWAIAIVLLNIFQCTPIGKTFDMSIQGSCISEWAFLFGMGLPSVLADWMILLLPIRPVVQLNMSWSKKLSVVGIFMLGAFAAICSIVRLYFVMNDDNNPTIHVEDITYSWARGYYWSSIEIHIALICSCLPIFGTFFRNGGPLWSRNRDNSRRKTGDYRDAIRSFSDLAKTGIVANSIATVRGGSSQGLTNPSETDMGLEPEEIRVHRAIDIELTETRHSEEQAMAK